jgi:hypothetical protein
MPWTTPATFTPNAIAQSSWMNTYVRDNLAHLYSPPTAEILSTTNYTTTSASYVDIDASLQASIITSGGRLLIVANMILSGTNMPLPRYLLNGTWISSTYPTGGSGNTLFVHWTDALAPGTHTIKPQWYSVTGTVTMNLYHMTIREVS